MSPITEMCTNCQAAPWKPLTQSAAGSPVNLFRWRDGGKARVMKGGCGPNTPVWWVRFDPVTSSWRTCPVSTRKGVARSSLILPRSAMSLNGIVYLHKPLELPTRESGSSLWPTPTANDDNKYPKAHMRMKANMPGGPRQTITSLNVMVKAMERGEYPELWPTHKSSTSGPDFARTGREGSGTDDLVTAVVRFQRKDGNQTQPTRLNPNWVEWLMGFGMGWTEIESSEMPSSPK